MIDYKQIGLRIKRLREDEARKWKVSELAAKLDKDSQSVRYYEEGKSITLPMIEKLATVFEVNEELLLFGRSKVALPDQPTKERDPRAARIAADFYFLNEPDKKKIYLDVRSKADANRVLMKQLIGNKLEPPSDEYVDKVLNHSPKRRRKYGKNI